MHVLYDYRVFTRAPYSGVSRYIVELHRQMSVTPGVQSTLAAFLTNNRILREEPAPGTIMLPFPGGRIGPRISQPLNDLATSVLLAARHFDVVHQSHYNLAIGRKPGRAMVSTAHDMIHELFPEFFPSSDYAEVKRVTLERSDAIIAISHHTKADLVERFGYPEDKISVVHHGIPKRASAKAETPRHGFPYLLYVGGRQHYKNFDGLLKAFAGSRSLGTDFKLVVFGGGPLSGPERALVDELGIADRLVFDGGSDAVLANCYAHAAAFIYPSRYEGFGLPLLESMIEDTPVVCADASCFPEIAGDAAAYFDPADPSSIATTIEAVVYDSGRAAQLVAAGRIRAAQFSWDRCAGETLAVYRTVAA